MIFPLGGLQGFSEQRLHVLRADPLAPTGHRAWINRKFVDEIVEAAEVHPVTILQQAGDNRFIAFIECMLQIMQANHQPGWFAGASLL